MYMIKYKYENYRDGFLKRVFKQDWVVRGGS